MMREGKLDSCLRYIGSDRFIARDELIRWLGGTPREPRPDTDLLDPGMVAVDRAEIEGMRRQLDSWLADRTND